MYRCIIVDDEPLAVDLLVNFVDKVSFMKVEKTFRNPIEAFDYLQRNTVDLVFLDIQMPDLTGMEIAEQLKSGKVIFTTAYRQYAAESYDVEALDYLIKPFAFSRFMKAIQKLGLQNESKTSPIQIKAEGKTFRLDQSEIIYVESFKDYVEIHTKDQVLTSYTPISHVYQMLDRSQFLRIHRAFIVSLTSVKSYTSTVVEISDQQLPIGRTFKHEAIEVLRSRP